VTSQAPALVDWNNMGAEDVEVLQKGPEAIKKGETPKE
jgi:hypothetical protein